MMLENLRELGRLTQALRLQGFRKTVMAGTDKIFRQISGLPPRRFSQITPQIILGGQPAKHVLDDLVRAGVTGVVNMRDEYDYQDEIGTLQLRYLRLATIDRTAPSLDHLQRGVEFIKKEIDSGGSVYIHCWEGLGRGPTMAAAYFVSQGTPIKDAWDKIRSIRPFISPTLGQIQQLEKFAALYYPLSPMPSPQVEVTEVLPPPIQPI